MSSTKIGASTPDERTTISSHDVVPRMSPQQVAFLVKLYRAARLWDPMALALKSGLTLNEIERLEAGEPSGAEIKMRVANALGIQDQNFFVKPWPFSTLVSHEKVIEMGTHFEGMLNLKAKLKL